MACVGLSKSKATIHRGEDLELGYTVYPTDTTESYFTSGWVSKNPEIASNVTALSKGTAAITVECQGFKSTSTILVDAPVKSISIDPGDSVIHRGETLNLRPVIDTEPLIRQTAPGLPANPVWPPWTKTEKSSGCSWELPKSR